MPSSRVTWGIRLSMIIVGAIIVITGLIYGATSKQVISPHSIPYIQSVDGTIYQLSQGTQSGNVYIHAEGSDEYYVAFNRDFQVPQSDIDTPHSINFIARSDTSTLDPALNTSSGLKVTEAHKIEKLVFADNNNIVGTFTTAEYDANPNGIRANSINDYINNWPAGLAISAVGLVLVLLSLFIRRKKPQAFFIAPRGGIQQPMYGQPMGNPYPSNANPYAQPSPNPYPQPNANPYASNPYQGAGQPPANPYPPYPPQPQ